MKARLLTAARDEQRELVNVVNGQAPDGALVKLNTNPHFSEAWPRHLIAEMRHGTAKKKFLGFGQRLHDYHRLKAVAHLVAGYKVTSLDQFELKPVKGNSTVVYRGLRSAWTRSTSA